MKTRSTSELSRLLRKCAQFFDEVSEADLARFLDGSLKLALVGRSGERARAQEGPPSAGRDVLEAVLEKLSGATSREDALRQLQDDERISGKNDLVELAKRLRIHVTKQDNLDALEDKIVEAVVGVKLRSDAIRGVNLKSGSAVGRSTESGEEVGTPERASDDRVRR